MQKLPRTFTEVVLGEMTSSSKLLQVYTGAEPKRAMLVPGYNDYRLRNGTNDQQLSLLLS